MQPFTIKCSKKPDDGITCQLHLDSRYGPNRGKTDQFSMRCKLACCTECEAGSVEFTGIGKARYERGWKSTEGVKPLSEFSAENQNIEDVLCEYCSEGLLSESQLKRRDEITKKKLGGGCKP